MMNQNSFFSLPRFAKYSTGRFKLHLPQMLLWAGVAFIVLVGYLVFFINTNDRTWQGDSWSVYLVVSTIIVGALSAGTSFPEFRSKLATQSFLMIPVSNFEKFSYEFLERIVLFFLVFPIIAVAAGYAGIFVSDVIASAVGEKCDLSYPHEIFKSVELLGQTTKTGNNISSEATNSEIALIFVYIFSFTCVFFFACTLVFRRNALIKTIILLGLGALLSGGLSFSINKVLGTKVINGITIDIESVSLESSVSALVLLVGIMLFSYFKLKEKEVK